MADKPRSAVLMNDFPGMVTGVDVRDLPEGVAELQINARSERAGELTVRPGYKKVLFEEE